MSKRSIINQMNLCILVIVTIFVLTSLELGGYQNISAISSDSNNFTGRISSILTPVSSSSDVMGTSMMTPDTATTNRTVRDEQSRMEAMRFSMAQDVTWLLSGDWNLFWNHRNDTTAAMEINTTEPPTEL